MSLNALRFLISDALLILFMILLVIGIIGMFRFKSSYGKILNSSKIDSVASLLLFLALIIRANSLSVMFKLMVVSVFYMITSPVINQFIAFAIKKQATELALAEREVSK